MAACGILRPAVMAMALAMAGCAGPKGNCAADAKAANLASGEDFFASTGTEWYSAFNQPSAQSFKGKTYIAYPDADYDPAVICFDHARQSWSKPVKVGRNPLAAAKDSHGNPALLIDKAGILHVFYGCHVGPMQYARSSLPGSIEHWQAMPAPAPKATYPQVMQMSDGTIFLFYRAGGHCDDWVYRTTARGDRWSQPAAVLRGVPPGEAWYASFVKGPGDTVHAGFVYKDDANLRRVPGPEFTHRYDAYYMQRRGDGVWVNAAGAALTLPLARVAAYEQCLVYDSWGRREVTGACSVGVDSSNAPYLLFRTAGLYGARSYRHRLARRQAGAWDIVDVGPTVEAGFESFARDDNFQLQVLPAGGMRAFVANTVAGSPARTDLAVWESRDRGGTWRAGRTILSSTNYPAGYVLISPKLVAEADREGYLIFGVDRRYLYGDEGFVRNPNPE